MVIILVKLFKVDICFINGPITAANSLMLQGAGAMKERWMMDDDVKKGKGAEICHLPGVLVLAH